MWSQFFPHYAFLHHERGRTPSLNKLKDDGSLKETFCGQRRSCVARYTIAFPVKLIIPNLGEARALIDNVWYRPSRDWSDNGVPPKEDQTDVSSRLVDIDRSLPMEFASVYISRDWNVDEFLRIRASEKAILAGWKAR